MNIEEIIEENRRRTAAIEAPYDPVRGDSRDPGRREVVAPDGSLCFVPVAMLSGNDPRQFEKMSMQAFHALRCRHDFPYWAATCCFIKKKGGGDDMLFRLNYPQRRLVAILEEMRLAGLPIRLVLLKARQWGGSTCTQLYMAWLQLMVSEGLNSLIVAHQHAATAEIRDMFMRMIARYPDDMMAGEATSEESRKPFKKRTEGAGPGTIRIPSRNFKVKVSSAERPDSCLGGDYNLVHCSEVAFWKKARLHLPEDMFRSAVSGVLLRPLTMILLESTANGTGNFFHSEYMAAREGSSQFRHLFIPWFEIEQYSSPFRDQEEKRAFAASLWEGRLSDHSDSPRRQPGAYLWWLWQKGASLEAIRWYVSERAKYSDHGKMASVYPSDDVEAFVHSGARVFDPYKVKALEEGCRRLQALTGEVTSDAPAGKKAIQNVRFTADIRGALRVWKKPQPPEEGKNPWKDRYLVVVDIGGRSLTSDWSVIAVFDRIGMASGHPPEVAAQWRGHTDFDLLAWKAAAIAAYYDNALLVIESNTLETRDADRDVEGDQSHFLLNRLREAYPNLYKRRRSSDEIRQGRPVKYGFHTNVATKPMIISNLVAIVRDGLYIERDEECLIEYLNYEQRQNGSYGALQGTHDDILMTRAIGLHICFNEMPVPKREDEGVYALRPRPGSITAM